jgi:parvulin-like peptidyl-prolyl isomerase
MTRSVLVLAIAVLLGCGGGSSDDGWVAEVDGVKVPSATLRRMVDDRMDDAPDAQRGDVVSDVLNMLVSEQAALNRASQLGVSVSDADLEKRLLQLHGDGWKDEDPGYRELVRRQMTVDRVALLDLASRARVSESEVHAYYDEHRAEYAQPERVQIRQIVVPEKAKAEQLRAELEKGADFATLARENSIAPEAPAGGALPAFARGQLPEAFDRAFELMPGRLSPVIESPYGFHVFLLEQRLPATEPTFEDVRARIEAELGQRHLEDLRREWLRGLRKSAEIHLNESLLESLQ